ncbi:MAG: alpha/beta fold hydrolase [Verrucomicrobia bacterium]|nr:alpha/beta fold hydrolase [Verrucomicrobiota bacterium]
MAGKPVLVLHGLLGSSRNWSAAGKALATSHRVLAADLRNHGESPHLRPMDYPAMVEDLLGLLESLQLPAVHLIGHSMGGKAAMLLTCRFPERVSSLTVVDIAPRAYPPRWEKEFALLRRLPVEQLQSRSEAEAELSPEIRDWAFRQFLLSNLERAEEGGFRWRVPLALLEESLPNLFQQMPPPGEAAWPGPALFLRGENSRFVGEADLPLIREFFPAGKLETVAGAGHNVHFDQRDRFVRRVRAHLEAAER